MFDTKQHNVSINSLSQQEMKRLILKEKRKLYKKRQQEKRDNDKKVEFNNYISLLNKKYPNFNYTHKDDLKSMHRLYCFSYTKIIRNIIINNFGDKKNLKETVLIEFRPMPNLEFLIRNTIIKLPNWNHTVICGNNNYSFIKEICDIICENSNSSIKIIKLDINNLTPSQYSELLTTTKFWENLKGTKILLYQEDTMLFKNNIDEFLKYDYVGAPWPKNQDDNLYGVGNGGFSLRTKSKMIQCIKKVKPENLILGNSTKRYMKYTNSTFVPEDVYFSKSLIENKIGKVAKRNVAIKFSQETQKSKSPLGGHNFWLAENKISCKYVVTLNLKTDYSKTSNHRYGWKSVIDNLYLNSIITDHSYKNSIDFIDCMESYFIWNNNKPLTRPWFGVLHYCDKLPNFYTKWEKIDGIFEKAKESFTNCKGLITLSEESKKNALFKLNKINKLNNKAHNIKIYSLKHPIQEIKNKFNLSNFIKNKDYKIIQLGKQYRRVSDIYMIKTQYKKIWLSGFKNINDCFKILNKELRFLNTKPNNKVECYYTKTLEEYDNMLLNNIIIIPLWNATANNSLLECLESNIPAFISRLPSTEEYLGKDYPMFYNHVSDIEPIINNKQQLHKKYKKTYKYLLKFDKSKIRHKYFNSELLKIINGYI
jgi:hypothetical protein